MERTRRERNPEQLRRFGANLRAARLSAGLSQDDLARRCGLHSTELSRLERGVLDPRLSTVLEAAKGLRVPAADLMGGLP